MNPGQIELCVLLDDGAKALSHPGFAESWRDWLRLSNALNLSQAPLTIGTLGMAPRVDLVTPPVELEVEIDLPSAWKPAYDSASSDEQRTFVRELAARGVPAPDELDPEVGDIGIIVHYAWTDLKVAVMEDPDPDDIADLAAEGWHLLGTDPEVVAATLPATMS